MDWPAFAFALGLCVAMAAAEGVLSARDLPRWLASLRHPRLYAPMWVWIVAAAATYAIQGFVAYRLAPLALGPAGAVGLAALIAVMAANVAYNAVVGRTRSPRLLYLGIVWFLPLLGLLQAALLVADPLAAGLNALYALWVVGYDLPIMRAVWRLNS